MARITSLNILLEQEGKDYLSELYGKVIENVQKSLISGPMKNQELSGDPTSGSVEAKRFANATSKQYGTARAAGKGDALRVKPVTIQIDQDREIIEELEEKDIKLYGVDGVLNRRSVNHVRTMQNELDEAFFACAAAAATNVETAALATSTAEMLERVILACETTKNAFVNGVPRNMIHLVCAPEVYAAVRNSIDTETHNANVNTAAEEIGRWHGVRIQSCANLPEGVECIVMAEGSVAQPVHATQYAAEKIGLSNAYGISLFFHYGTKAVTPDLIYKVVADNNG